MTIYYTTLLGLAKPETGTEAGTWGNVVNTQITTLVEDAIASTATVDVTAEDKVLSTDQGATNEARCAIINIIGTPGTARFVTAPSLSKVYIVINNSDSTITFRGAGSPPTTGVAINAGEDAIVSWDADATDFRVVGGGGDVVGPSSATDSTLPLFDGSTGKLLKTSGKAVPSGVIVGTTDTQTLTNKAVSPRIVATTGSSLAITATSTDIASHINTLSSGTITISAPSGTPVDGQKIIIRLQTTNTQTLSFDSVYSGSSDQALPGSSSGSSKWDYMGFIYNSTALKWQMVAKNFGF